MLHKFVDFFSIIFLVKNRGEGYKWFYLLRYSRMVAGFGTFWTAGLSLRALLVRASCTRFQVFLAPGNHSWQAPSDQQKCSLRIEGLRNQRVSTHPSAEIRSRRQPTEEWASDLQGSPSRTNRRWCVQHRTRFPCRKNPSSNRSAVSGRRRAR